MSKTKVETHEAGHLATSGFGRIGQQILNLWEHAGARAAERRSLRALGRRELEDCGLTFADVTPGLPDLYANDFRVAHIGELRAA